VNISEMNAFYKKHNIKYKRIKKDYLLSHNDIVSKLLGQNMDNINDTYVKEDAMLDILYNNKKIDIITNFIFDRMLIDHIIPAEYFTEMADYEKFYKISNYGRVLSVRTTKIVKMQEFNDYYHVTISK